MMLVASLRVTLVPSVLVPLDQRSGNSDPVARLVKPACAVRDEDSRCEIALRVYYCRLSAHACSFVVTRLRMVTNFEAVFITGCNRGIGLEFVKQFLKLPTPPKHVFTTCRSLASELQSLAEDNSNLHVLELEVNDENGINRVASEVDKKLGETGLNLLINNAGIAGKLILDETTAERMRDVYNTNVVAPLMLTKALLPLLRRAAVSDGFSLKPVIVNMSSKVGSVEDNSSGRHYAYRASKAALNMVTKSLSIDLANDGIMAVSLHPGWVKTDMGGPNAIISTEESVTSLISVICSLDESKNGGFFDYNGKVIPW